MQTFRVAFNKRPCLSHVHFLKVNFTTFHFCGLTLLFLLSSSNKSSQGTRLLNIKARMIYARTCRGFLSWWLFAELVPLYAGMYIGVVFILAGNKWHDSQLGSFPRRKRELRSLVGHSGVVRFFCTAKLETIWFKKKSKSISRTTTVNIEKNICPWYFMNKELL